MAVLIWLAIGGGAIGLGRLFPGALLACGPDDLPDLIVTHFDVAKSDYIFVTVENIGPCSAEASYGNLEFGKGAGYTYFNPPAIGPFQSVVVKRLIPGIYGKFHSSPSTWELRVDALALIQELDEYNNTLLVSP
jgi:hypothetical protein